jgi:hypothetical protein
MIQVYPVRPDKREVIPAVTHVDGSGRLQSVSRDSNPRYWALIRAFADRTGVPVLLNTSFNENEPIVERPEQALDCFLRTDMDTLVMGPLPRNDPARVCFSINHWPDRLPASLAELADLVAASGGGVTVVAGPRGGGRSSRQRSAATGCILRARDDDLARSFGPGGNYLTYFLSRGSSPVGSAPGRPCADGSPIIGRRLAAAQLRPVFFCQDIFPEVTALEDFRSPPSTPARS